MSGSAPRSSVRGPMLPRHEIQNRAPVRHESRKRARKAQKQDPLMADLQPKGAKRVLLVDDDPDLRAALLEQLRLHEEFEPAAVENASHGLQKARDERFDAILLDVNLPDMDG